MSLIGSLALALQVTVSIGSDGARARVGEEGDSTGRRPVKRLEVTDEMRRTAFKDPAARDLLLRARASRMQHDSHLLSYSAKSYQRISVGMSLRETTRSRLAFRSEAVSRVQWHKDVGVHVEVLGARSALPIAGDASKEAENEVRNEAGDMMAIPYYPGKDQLWMSDGLARAEVDEREIVHPIAEGAEAYYTYATGDSVIMTLPDGKRITLRELRITAREPKWNVTVGSFWFDTDRANLVRAIYRLSTQMNIWTVAQADDSTAMDDVPIWVRPLLTPMLADITAISVEYGLQDQQFWLPKTRGFEGYARVSFMRVPIAIEQRYVYEHVNALEALPAIPAIPVAARVLARDVRDSLYKSGLDTAAVRTRMREFYAARDSSQKAERVSQCAAGPMFTEYRRRFDGTLPVAVQVPCDTARLSNSAELPGSIYDRGEEVFGEKERDVLLKALTMGLQPGWGPQAPVIEYGLAYTRFNRIEGFSTAATVQSTLGKGYLATLGLRGSAADLQLNGDLTMARSNGRREVRATAFRRLGVSSDFGDPLSFGASLASVLYGRDEGFYHRAWGAEVAGRRPMRGGLDWRLFAEQQWSATVENTWSLFGGANDPRFPGNVVADEGWYYGAALRWRGSRGLDPRGWRLTGDVRLEGAAGERAYGRGLVESTVSRGLGPVAASLTAAAGTSEGDLPTQRHYFLGGLQSVRGQSAGAGFGEAFWMGRLELGANRTGVRPVVFGDLGWAGPRDGWRSPGRPMSGVGVGASFLDGMIRVDLSRGIHPRVQTRFDLYLEARF